MNKSVLSTLPFMLCIISCEFGGASSFKDPRDGKEYKTIKIGEQVWMAENLNYVTGINRCYDDDEENCNKYGRHYDWETAKKACPEGWHLPNNEEWENISVSKFAALPGGYSNAGGDFAHLGDISIWWSASDTTDHHAYNWNMNNKGERVSRHFSNKSWLFNVRCIKN